MNIFDLNIFGHLRGNKDETFYFYKISLNHVREIHSIII